MIKWRMKSKCANCPFATKGPGLRLRKSLEPWRWASILVNLLSEKHFMCHRTTNETGNGTNLLCAGSIEWQQKRGIKSQLLQVMERLTNLKQ